MNARAALSVIIVRVPKVLQASPKFVIGMLDPGITIVLVMRIARLVLPLAALVVVRQALLSPVVTAELKLAVQIVLWGLAQENMAARRVATPQHLVEIF